MLRELKVKNFAIVEDGRLQLGAGMTSFTGETGAGKSLLFDAVTLLLGGKARSHLVRTGASSAEVEGVFDLSKDSHKRSLAAELGFEIEEEDDHLLFVRREISGGNDAGRNRVWIQGRSATRSQLQQLLGDWVEVSGQHEFLKLGNEDYILGIVDQYGDLREEARLFEVAYEAHAQLLTGLEQAKSEQENRVHRAGYLRFQIEELEKAGISPEAAQEEERLLALRAKLGSLERVQRALDVARGNVDGFESGDESSAGALARVQAAARELASLSDLGEEFRDLVVRLDQASEVLSDFSAAIGRIAASLEADPESLEAAESQLSQLNRVKRKYQSDVPALVEALASARAELERLESSEERVSDLQEKLVQSQEKLVKQARRLHARREESAVALAKSWEKDLKLLGMKQARLQLKVSELIECRSTGLSRVEALFTANVGEEPRPLGKVASGGELSRILLALKHIVAGRSEIGIYLFDEVDAGIGGETAHAVASRLRGIAKDNQVVVVTHLAQIAATSHEQFRIRKMTEKGKTRTVIEKMDREDRAEEIARMLGDTGSRAAQKLARELLAKNA